MAITIYSFLLTLGLAVSAPWWLWRMASSGRYREGLAQRLGQVPVALQAAVEGRRVIWVHAVSVGEVFAAARLVKELRERLGGGWIVVVSTTTATGQKVARERFGSARVFYFPLDFAWTVRRYLRALRPELMVLVESELWPRLLHECERARVPVAVVNARMSDRSFRRATRVRSIWGWMGRKVALWLPQGEEMAARLRALDVAVERVRVSGNLKYDLNEPIRNQVSQKIAEIAHGRSVIVAGSTLAGSIKSGLNEEEMMVQAWEGLPGTEHRAMLVLAPRHPARFGEVAATAAEFFMVRASELKFGKKADEAEIVVLDTIGDLAAVYRVASLAFIGGSLVPKGGHNPLEAARFGVPVVMGPSYQNFREIVEGMHAADAIRIVDADGLAAAMVELLKDDGGMGERGRAFFRGQAGATGRTVAALLELIRA